ncbi:MAG TPA: hydrogenobyrinic acid a,c-diamide synthase (glutamine-hydrolyzing), partial [Thiolinea sp.]|nr:hydrogenobyrinic acid a,c-diamide synthase (glutamine-hydrolyzing) [Thiolinea sp.]
RSDYPKGVILNRTGGSRHEGKLCQAVALYTDLPVLGAVRDSPELVIDERHLGLMPSNEHLDAERQIIHIRELIAAQVDTGRVLQLAEQADERRPPVSVTRSPGGSNGSDVRIGICRDPAFGFYYPDDLEALQQAGAVLVNVDTLKDTSLPSLDGLFIGGGFPETRLHELAANQALRSAIRTAIDNGLPTYAECGGLMYLARSLSWNGARAEMAGVIPGDAVMYPRPQGRGYVHLEPTADMPWPGGTGALIRAHEFHYSRLENLAPGGRFAFRVLRGSGIDGTQDGWVYKNLLASYAHLRSTPRFDWASHFVNFVRNQQRRTML